MRKYFFIFIILLISFSIAQSNIIQGRRDGGAACDDCSGDLKFSWHMENTNVATGTPCGCSDGDEDASEGGTPSLSGTQKSDGSYSAYGTSTDYYQFTISHPDLINTAEGKVIIDIYVTSWSDGVRFFDAYYSSGENISATLTGSSSSDIEVRVSHNGDWQELEATAGTGKGENEWLRVTIQWDESQSAADLEVTLCNLTLPDTTSNCASSGADNDIDGTFTNPPNLLRFGALDTVGVYVDNVQIYGESGL